MSIWNEGTKNSPSIGDQKNLPGKDVERNYANDFNDINSIKSDYDEEAGSKTTEETSSRLGTFSKNYIKKFGQFLVTNPKKTYNKPFKSFSVEIPIETCEIHENFKTIDVCEKKSSINDETISNKSVKILCIENECKKIDMNQSVEVKNESENVNKGETQNGLTGDLNTFLLPRVILKPGLNPICNEDTGFEHGYEKSGRERISSSHYSTEKSGSSGYYSSNLYSTSSVDEHIYSEPVTDPVITTNIPNKIDIKNIPKILDRKLPLRPVTIGASFDSTTEKPEIDDYVRKKLDKLPTIMEGIDGQIPKPVWPMDFDDSLMDINLEPFLLVNDAPQLKRKFSNSNLGVDNQCYDSSDDDLNRSSDKSLALYLKQCEETTIVQNTTDILEGIRKKLDSLLEQAAKTEIHQGKNATEAEPTDLAKNIQSLKSELDSYLQRIKSKKDLEIKQLCTGLSKNTKMLTMKKALENRSRKNSQDEDGYEIFQTAEDLNGGYEQMMPKNIMTNYQESNSGLNFDTVYVQDGFSLCDSGAVPFAGRFSSTRSTDTNFQLKRNFSKDFSNVVNDKSDVSSNSSDKSSDNNSEKNQLKQNLALHHPILIKNLDKTNGDDKDMILEWHNNKPSIWELYYGKNRPIQTIVKKVKKKGKKPVNSVVSYPSTRPESDFTLDLPRAEQLRIKMKKEKQCRYRCRLITSLLSLLFFVLTVMAVSLILTKGKRMFGSML